MGEYRIIVVDTDPVWRRHLKAFLSKMGYWVIGEAEDGFAALKIIRNRQPDLIITEASLPGMDGIELARIIHEDKLAPVILIASSHQEDVLGKAKGVKAFALLFKPVDETILLPAVELALANYQEIVKLENELKKLKDMLETRKMVERAKGILMETYGLSEADAFKRMQRQSMNKRISMRAVAEAIILAHEV